MLDPTTPTKLDVILQEIKEVKALLQTLMEEEGYEEVLEEEEEPLQKNSKIIRFNNQNS